jgi:hypothetical protein
LASIFPASRGPFTRFLSAPASSFEIVLGYVGAAATKSIILGLIILATAGLFVPLNVAHPIWMLVFLTLTAVSFSLFGFILGIWADGFEKLQVVPLLIITPLTFLGGTFYSISVLPPVWQTIALFNPGGLSDQRISLELLRNRRRGRRRKPRDDALVSGRVPFCRVVDFQDRVPAQEIVLPAAAAFRLGAGRMGPGRLDSRTTPV